MLRKLCILQMDPEGIQNQFSPDAYETMYFARFPKPHGWKPYFTQFPKTDAYETVYFTKFTNKNLWFSDGFSKKI